MVTLCLFNILLTLSFASELTPGQESSGEICSPLITKHQAIYLGTAIQMLDAMAAPLAAWFSADYPLFSAVYNSVRCIPVPLLNYALATKVDDHWNFKGGFMVGNTFGYVVGVISAASSWVYYKHHSPGAYWANACLSTMHSIALLFQSAIIFEEYEMRRKKALS